MKRLLSGFGLLAIAGAIIAIARPKSSRPDLPACVQGARDYSRLSLRGNVTVLRCSMELGGRDQLLVGLDSTTAAQTSSEAASSGKYQRIGVVSDTLGPELFAAMHDKRGWYVSTLGLNSNGGYTIIIFDEDARTVYVDHIPF